jgi:hypothetical protein
MPKGNKLSPQEKKAREEFLANEKPTERTKRVVEPRIKKLISQIRTVGKCFDSPRYVFTPEQKDNIINTLTNEMDNALQKLEGSTSEEIKDIL